MPGPLIGLFAVIVTLAGGALQKAEATRVSVRDGVYSVAQAARGEKTYKIRCGSCHQPAQFTAPTFLQSWQGQTADVLFNHIRTTMPQENPGGMKRQEYADVLAYIFKENGLPPGDHELEATDEALARLVIETPAAPSSSKGGR